MRKLVLLLALLSGPAFPADETAPQAFKTIPPLPKAATRDLDCSFGPKMRQRVEEMALRDATAMQAPGASEPTMSMTPAQMQALQQLTDPAFSMCPIEVMQLEAVGWSVAPEEKLAARLAEINATKQKSDGAWCETHAKNNVECDPDPNSAKRFNAQTTAAGTQYLKDLAPGYAKYMKQVGDCLALRDKPVAAAQGVKGALGALALGANGQNWALVSMVAEAQSKACATAKEAAGTYLDQQ